MALNAMADEIHPPEVLEAEGDDKDIEEEEDTEQVVKSDL